MHTGTIWSRAWHANAVNYYINGNQIRSIWHKLHGRFLRFGKFPQKFAILVAPAGRLLGAAFPPQGTGRVAWNFARRRGPTCPLAVTNFTWIGARSHPCGVKMLIFGPRVKLITARTHHCFPISSSWTYTARSNRCRRRQRFSLYPGFRVPRLVQSPQLWSWSMPSSYRSSLPEECWSPTGRSGGSGRIPQFREIYSRDRSSAQCTPAPEHTGTTSGLRCRKAAKFHQKYVSNLCFKLLVTSDEEVSVVFISVWLFVCQQHFVITIQPIFKKFGGKVMAHGQRKIWSDSVGNPDHVTIALGLGLGLQLGVTVTLCSIMATRL